MASLTLKWPFDSEIKSVAYDGKFGRYWKYDKLAGFPHQGSDYREKCNTDWWWPLSGKIDLFEKRSYGYGYYSRIRATNGWYFGIAHGNKLAGYKGKIVKAGEYGGKTGNTGLGKGCHAHIELRNPQGKVVNPETNIKWIPRKVKMYLTKTQKTKICKDLLGRNCSPTAYNLKLTREGLFNRAYMEVATNLKSLKHLRTVVINLVKDKKILKDRISKLERGHKDTLAVVEQLRKAAKNSVSINSKDYLDKILFIQKYSKTLEIVRDKLGLDTTADKNAISRALQELLATKITPKRDVFTRFSDFLRKIFNKVVIKHDR